jgi:predicted dehydrogenase
MPLASRGAEVDQLIAAASAAGVQVVEAFMYRHHPMNLKVRELVESGSLGEVRYLWASFSFELAQAPNIRWQPETGGGSLWDVGCYPVSYARMVFGGPPVEFYASQQLGASGIDLSFTGQMRYANGAYAQVESSFALPYYTAVEIRGSQGTIRIPRPFNPSEADTHITVTRGDISEEYSFHYPLLYQGEIEDLADAILNRKAPRLPLPESRELIATLTGLYRSAALNRPLTYNPDGYER